MTLEHYIKPDTQVDDRRDASTRGSLLSAAWGVNPVSVQRLFNGQFHKSLPERHLTFGLDPKRGVIHPSFPLRGRWERPALVLEQAPSPSLADL